MIEFAPKARLLPEDLDHVLQHTRGAWEGLRGQNIFITGGTGFFGRWLLETFAHANKTLDLKSKLVVLSRNPNRFSAAAPHLTSNGAIELIEGNVRSLTLDKLRSQLPTMPKTFRFFIHAGTEANSNLNSEDPLQMLDTIVEGTRKSLEFAAETGVRRFLFVSSGAVYGRQPPEMSVLSETYLGGPDYTTALSAYAEAKRLGELLCSCYEQRGTVEAVIARCFSFYGPHLPIDTHQAIGNFIRDAIEGRSIRVTGDGSPQRSYLYAADLAAWLWKLLFEGTSGRAYNVGSSVAASVAEWARRVGGILAAGASVEVSGVADATDRPSRYVPDITRARTELRLEQWIGADEGLRRTGCWLERSGLAGKAFLS